MLRKNTAKIAKHGQMRRCDGAVAVTGCSARSIYRAFQKHRGYSPLELSKHRRLEKAHRLLIANGAKQSVAVIADICGFGDLSHFSRDYRQTFGESPSRTRAAGGWNE